MLSEDLNTVSPILLKGKDRDLHYLEAQGHYENKD